MFMVLRSGLALLILCLLSTPEASACSQQVHWKLTDSPCSAIPSGVAKADAGSYGMFYYSASAFQLNNQACGPVLDGGDEILEIYPNYNSDRNVWPCDDDSCHISLAEASAQSADWIAVLDPEEYHAETVAALIDSVTDGSLKVAVVLLEKTLSTCVSPDDLDVLVKLAEIAAAAEAGSADMLALNMSFGRAVTAADLMANSPTCSGSISCQIGKLLSHLARPLPDGSVEAAIVAAAGNDDQLLFPAHLDRVIAAGALDMSLFAGGGEIGDEVGGDVEPTWETPDLGISPRVLMPGSGICLDDGVESWALSPGSSYSSAFASGLLAAALVENRSDVEQLLPKSKLWYPIEVCSDQEELCHYEIAQGGVNIAPLTAGASDTFDAALHEDLASCGVTRGAGLSFDLLLERTFSDPRHYYPNLVELVALHQPLPAPDTCAPCTLNFQHNRPPAVAIEAPPDGLRGSRTTKAGSTKAAAGARSASFGTASVPRLTAAGAPVANGNNQHEQVFRLAIDSHSTWPLQGNMELKAVYLRFGQHVFRVVDEDSMLPDDFRLAFEDGDVSQINLTGTIDSRQFFDQPSLITLLRLPMPPPQPERLFWRSTPMTLR